MSNIEEKKFDYSLVDTDTANRLKKKEEELKNRATRVIKDTKEIGKIFYEEQQNLARFGNGTFMSWYKSQGFKTNFVYDTINYYKGSTLLMTKELEKLPKYAVAAIGSDVVEEEVKEKIKSGEIKTQKEMNELRKKLNAERKEKDRMEKQLKQQIKQLKNADPEKEYVEVTKEVIPDDYEEMKKTLETIERKKNELEERKEELEERVGDINTAKSEVREALKRKKTIDEEINDLIEYQQALEDQNNVMKHRAEIVQGVKRDVEKALKPMSNTKMLLDRDVEMTEDDLEELEFTAKELEDYANLIYRYVSKKRNNQNFKEGDVIDVN